MDTGDIAQSIPPPLPPSASDSQPWGVGWAASAFLGFIAIQFIPAVMAVIGYGIYRTSQGMPMPKVEADFPAILLMGAAIVSHLLLILFLFLLVRFVHGMNFRRGISWDARKPFAAWKAASVAAGLVAFNVVILTIFPAPEDANIPIKRLTESTGGLFLFGFIAVLLAPISEELLFRGYMFAPIEKRLGSAAAVIITALLFMTPHLPQLGEFWQGAVLIGFLGIGAGLLRARTGGLWASYLCHLVYNVILVFFEVLGRFSPAS